MSNQVCLLIQGTILEIPEITKIESCEDWISFEMQDGQSHDFCFDEPASKIYQKIMLVKSCISS